MVMAYFVGEGHGGRHDQRPGRRHLWSRVRAAGTGTGAGVGAGSITNGDLDKVVLEAEAGKATVDGQLEVGVVHESPYFVLEAWMVQRLLGDVQRRWTGYDAAWVQRGQSQRLVAQICLRNWFSAKRRLLATATRDISLPWSD
jgi:hypothetical protein